MINKNSIGEIHDNKFGVLATNNGKGLDHFNIVREESFIENETTSISFKRRDLYKIMLVKGDNLVQFADKRVRIKKQAIAFLSPQIPYRWDYRDGCNNGIYCVFHSGFFNKYYQFEQYEVFRLNCKHIFELDDQQYAYVYSVFHQMEKEYKSDYKYKYDLIRNQILKLVHFGLKLEPSINEQDRTMNASQRISTSFLILLEQQFGINKSSEMVGIRTPSEFAEQLNIHVNHLNRSIKENLGQSTSQIIKQRILRESKNLLQHTSWKVADIAYALGFAETTHFNNFFKKHVELSPLKFRSQKMINMKKENTIRKVFTISDF